MTTLSDDLGPRRTWKGGPEEHLLPPFQLAQLQKSNLLPEAVKINGFGTLPSQLEACLACLPRLGPDWPGLKHGPFRFPEKGSQTTKKNVSGHQRHISGDLPAIFGTNLIRGDGGARSKGLGTWGTHFS